MQSPQSQSFFQSYRDPVTGYDVSPSKQRSSSLTNRGSALANPDYQRSAQDIGGQADPFAHYPPREAPGSNRSSMYSQGAQIAASYPQEYVLAQQRMEPAHAPVPSVQQGANWLSGFQHQSYGGAGPPAHQYRDFGSQHAYNASIATQGRELPQFTQPVPPERRLPSSDINQYDANRNYDLSSRSEQYGTGFGYPVNFGERRGGLPQPQAYATQQDPYTSLTPRTLPAPTQQTTPYRSAGPPGSPAYPSIGTDPNSSSPASYGGNIQGYGYGNHPGQQDYR